MKEFDYGGFDLEPLGDLADEVEFRFSGGKQGGRPKPVTKIIGSQHIRRQEEKFEHC
jgi:hypothetical protein